MAFATVSDLEARWRILSDDERETAETLLEDASVFLAAVLDVETLLDERPDALRIVSCNLARRAMQSNGDAFDPFNNGGNTNSWTPTTEAGDWYLRAADKQLLGMGASVGSIRLRHE